MEKIINFLSDRIMAPVWNFLDGKKTAIGGGLSILAGLAGLGAEAEPLLSAHNTAGLIDLVKHLPSDPAYLAVAGGFAAIGIGHKIDKAAAAPAADAPAAPAPEAPKA